MNGQCRRCDGRGWVLEMNMRDRMTCPACEKSMARRADADPFTDFTKTGTIFYDHSCSRCDSGNKPCIKGKGRERDCDTLHARND